MAVHQESLKVIEKLLDKDPKKLNALDIAMANQHLLKLYEFFQEVEPVKHSLAEVSEKEKIEAEEKSTKKAKKPSTPGLFEINLFEEESEEEEFSQPEVKTVHLPSPTFEEEIDEDAIPKKNPLVDDIKMEIRETPQVEDIADVKEENEEVVEEVIEGDFNENFEEEEEEVEDNVQTSQEEILDEVDIAIEEPRFTKEVVEEQAEIEEQAKIEEIETEEDEEEEDNYMNKLSIAFEPPVSKTVWEEPILATSVFDSDTKSGYTYVDKDLHLEKKQVSNLDIRNMIGLNDRYLYSNELFFDKKIYENVLDELNTFKSKEEALSFLEPYLNKEVEDIDEEKNMDEVRTSFNKLLDRFYK